MTDDKIVDDRPVVGEIIHDRRDGTVEALVCGKSAIIRLYPEGQAYPPLERGMPITITSAMTPDALKRVLDDMHSTLTGFAIAPAPKIKKPFPDLGAIRARCEAATPGPWGCRSDEVASGIDAGRSPEPDPLKRRLMFTVVVGDKDATFIAHARNDVPDLLALVDAFEMATNELPAETQDFLRGRVIDMMEARA